MVIELWITFEKSRYVHTPQNIAQTQTLAYIAI